MSLFVVVEGIDGLGKTTLAESLAENIGAVYVRTPGVLRSYLANPELSEFDSYQLFVADRILTYTTKIKPALDSGRHVVCDRYHLSNYAYQSSTMGKDRVLSDLRNPPHLLLYCKGPLDLSVERRRAREEAENGAVAGGLARYEKEDHMRSAKGLYEQAIRDKGSCFYDDLEVIDATQSKQGMLKQSLKAFIDLLLLHEPTALEEATKLQMKLKELDG